MALAPRSQAEVVVGSTFELHFVSLNNPGRGVVVPCDAAGQVDMNGLTDRLKSAYLGARAMIGRDYTFPAVVRAP